MPAAPGEKETWEQLVLRTQGKDVTRCPRCSHAPLARVDLRDLDAETYVRVFGVPKPPPLRGRRERR